MSIELCVPSVYGERSGVGVQGYLEVLLAPPEISLDDAEREQARDFAEQLMQGYTRDGSSVHDPQRIAQGKLPRSLEQVNRISVASARHTFYMGYFDTPAGLNELISVGLVSDIEDADDLDYDSRLAAASRDNHIGDLQARLTRDPEYDQYQPEPEVWHHFNDPDKILHKFELLQSYLQFYRGMRPEVGNIVDWRMREVKCTLLDVHIRKVNSLIAGMYPTLLHLAQELQLQPESDETRRLQGRLVEVAPAAEYITQTDDPEGYKWLLTTHLDLVRNGAAWSENKMVVQPISQEVMALADELDSKGSDSGLPDAIISPELIQELAAIRWDAPQLKSFIETILNDWQLLSGEQTDWSAINKRSGMAGDEKWQVVITPKKQSMAVDGIKKVVFVPEKFSRTLTQEGEAGVLPLAAHELKHVIQSEYDAVIGQAIPLARMKGHNYVAMREMGGIVEERKLRAMLGQDRPVNTTYLRALQTKLAGGNRTQAARSFLEASLTRVPLEQRIRTAGKNILRLYRHGGNDSQSLNYIEQELILRSLSQLPEEQVTAIATAGGSFSLRDSAELHRVGLLELPKRVPQKPAEDVMRIYFERFHSRRPVA